jgi:hypothetical protein
MSHQLCNGLRIHASSHQVCSEAVSEIVPADGTKPRSLQSGSKCAGYVVLLERASHLTREHQQRVNPPLSKSQALLCLPLPMPAQRIDQYRIEGNGAFTSSFTWSVEDFLTNPHQCSTNLERSCLEVKIFPPER